MYKKITHTIVEEHFDHPMGVGIAANVGMPKSMRHSLAEIMPAGQFKTFVDNYFIKSEDALIDLANATFDESLDFQAALAKAMEYEGLGDMLEKYYDVEFKERFNQQLNNAILQLLFYWRNTIRKFDNKDTLNRIKTSGWAAGMLLNQYNNYWDRDIGRTLFDDFFQELINLGNAKFAKNKANETAAMDRLSAAGSKLSNYISTGAIQNHPEFFTP